MDNTNVDLYKFIGAPLPNPGIQVKDAGGSFNKCGEFIGNALIRVYGNFKDAHFKSFSLKVFGGNIASTGKLLTSVPYDGPEPQINDTGIAGATDPGNGQSIYSLNLCTELTAAEKIKCAYGLEMTVRDRAIVGYNSGYTFGWTDHHKQVYVTFNWDPAGC